MDRKYQRKLHRELNKYELTVEQITRLINEAKNEKEYLAASEEEVFGTPKEYAKKLIKRNKVQTKKKNIFLNLILKILPMIVLVMLIILGFDLLYRFTEPILLLGITLIILSIDQLLRTNLFNFAFIIFMFIILLIYKTIVINIFIIPYLLIALIIYIALLYYFKQSNLQDRYRKDRYFDDTIGALGLTEYEEYNSYFTSKIGNVLVILENRTETIFYLDNSFGEMIVDMRKIGIEDDITINIANLFGKITFITNRNQVVENNIDNKMAWYKNEKQRGKSQTITLKGINRFSRVVVK